MCGLIFEIEDNEGDLVVYASFGGLIMKIKGKKSDLGCFRKENESRIFVMMRKG